MIYRICNPLKIILLTLALCSINMTHASNAQQVKIFISKTTDHPALDATVNGIIDELAQNGYKIGDNLILRTESAQGSAGLAQAIATKFVSQKADIVVGVGTTAAQSFIKYAKTHQTKLIFASVTDPLSAGLIDNLPNPNSNIAGISNFIPLEPQLELLRKLLPSIKKIGILYNAGESNSAIIVKKLEALCPQFNLVLVKQTANKTSEVAQSTIKLAENSDVIFISNDNTALSAMPTVVTTADKFNIPVFVSDTDLVGTGPIAALGPNQYKIGIQTAKMIIKALHGANVGEQYVEFPLDTKLYLDTKKAKKLGITIPQDVLINATHVIK